jgi:RND family efflux transporter MFP subunit
VSRSRTIWIVAILALAIPGFLVVRHLMAAPVIATETVRAEKVERILAAVGRIRPRESVTVLSRVAGQVASMAKDEGDRVAAGDVLAQLDDRVPRAALAQAEAALTTASTTRDQAARDLERARELRRKGVATQSQLEQAETALKNADENVARLRAARDQSAALLADYTIRAPAAGRVLTRPVDPGQVVATSTVIFEIAAGDAYEVETDIDETYAQVLKPGMAARLSPAGVQRRVETATVVFVSPRVDVTTGGRTVRLAFDIAQSDLPPGLTVDVNIVVEVLDHAITVPRTAILDPEGTPYVLKQGGDKFDRVPVVFVDWPAERVTVSSGLVEGDVIAAQAASADPAAIRLTDVIPASMGQ